MTEAKIYLGNLSYDTRERWIDVVLHSVVVVVETAEGVVLCQTAKNWGTPPNYLKNDKAVFIDQII